MKCYIKIIFMLLLLSCSRRNITDNQQITHLTPIYETDSKIDNALKNIMLIGDDASLDTLMFTPSEYGKLRYLPYLLILYNEYGSNKALEEIQYLALNDTAINSLLQDMILRNYEK